MTKNEMKKNLLGKNMTLMRLSSGALIGPGFLPAAGILP